MPRLTFRPTTMRPSQVVAIALASFLAREACIAQGQPATIPTVVAQAMSLDFSGGVLGPPRYSVGTPPAGWPKELIPPKARVIGGGTLGSDALFHIRSLVVVMPTGTKPTEAIDAMAAKAGYSTRTPSEQASQGGFIESAGVQNHLPLCKGKTSLFSFAVVDSVASPHIFALNYLDGETARQNCSAAEHMRTSMQSAGTRSFGPKNLPPLVAPSGVAATPRGMSWSGTSGTMDTGLRTTMPADSILAHYTGQLVTAGWKLDGAVLANPVIGVQKFRFMDGEEAWSGMLIVEAIGKRREVTLRLAMVNVEP